MRVRVFIAALLSCAACVGFAQIEDSGEEEDYEVPSITYKEEHRAGEERYMEPTYTISDEEKEKIFTVKPAMVESGHFERILCEAYNNCTDPEPTNENAKPRQIEEGGILKRKQKELRERMREALLMRWNSVSNNILSEVEKQTGVCHALSTLQPVADLVISHGSKTDIDDATRLFSIVCPRVKSAFPSKTAELDCSNLHAKVVEYAASKDAASMFHIGSCCNCPAAQKEYHDMQSILKRQHAELKRAFEKGKPKEHPFKYVDPVIVDSINSTEARLIGGAAKQRTLPPKERDFERVNHQIYYHDDGETFSSGDLRMKAVSEKTMDVVESAPASLGRDVAFEHGSRKEDAVSAPHLRRAHSSSSSSSHQRWKPSAADNAMEEVEAASQKDADREADALLKSIDREVEAEAADMNAALA